LTAEAETLVAQVEAISREVRLAAIHDIPDEDIERTAAVLERICAVLATLPEREVA
jgi:MarR family transcriptional regulator for hemolysin